MTVTGPSPTWTELIGEASALLTAAGDAGLAVRVVGSTGIRLHCERAARAMDRGERAAKDIDLIVRSGDRKRLRNLIERRGYEIDRDLLVAMEGMRYSFSHPQRGIEVDVFVDRLEFCHKIELSDRLELHPQTIPVEDLLLQKLQVHDVTHNDLVDAAVVLATHELREGPGDPEEIDKNYIAELLGRDWGFHRTATENMDNVAGLLEGRTLPPELSETAALRLAQLREAIDAARKTRTWRLRARVGERMQWWEDVDDRRDTY
jgi:hypothetical protein